MRQLVERGAQRVVMTAGKEATLVLRMVNILAGDATPNHSCRPDWFRGRVHGRAGIAFVAWR